MTQSPINSKAAPTPTAQQKAAIETKHVSVVLSAGAGCGKTSVLTQRFLSHLEPGKDAADLSSLVAITFTERAAREMRERIRGQCVGRLRNCPPEQKQVDHWLKIVRELDSARISTIHSFCTSLLRANAVEAGLDPKFDLLDETLGESFLRQSVEKGLHELLVTNDVDIAELVFEFGLGRTRDLLASLVLQRYRITDSAKWDTMTGEVLAESWERRWHAVFVPQLMREAAESEPAQRTVRLLGEHVPTHPVMKERCQILLKQIPGLAEATDPAQLLAVIRENAQVRGGGTKKDWESEEVYANVRDALKALREKVIDKLEKDLEYEREHLLRGAEIGLCALRAATKVGRSYDARKAEKGKLDFDDLLLGAHKLLHDNADVRRRVASGIDLLMVDEFQDTDPIQYEIVQMLCGAAFLTGRLFVVGDSKQSIYRFRRADPKVFHALREKIDELGRLPLSMNFRSQPQILAFVNAVFDGALQHEYEPLVAKLPQVSQDPCIEFLFATAGPDEIGGDDDARSAAARRRREGEWIAGRLTQLLTDGIRQCDPQTDESTVRKVTPRDIVILFRSMTDVRYYEEALQRHEIPCYVVGGRAFFAQQEIYDVVNLCQYLDDVDDEAALIGVLRSPFFSLSDDSIVALAQSSDHFITQALKHAPPAFLPEQQQEQILRAGKVLAELREKKDRLPISQLLILAIELTGYDASLLTEFLGERKLANLRKLIDMARQFDRSGLFTLANFVDELRNSVAAETREALAAMHSESANVIRLMSIHQSKGLEFPVVVVADMDRALNSQTSAAHFDPDLGPVVGLPSKFGEERDHPGRRMLRKSERDEDLEEARRVLYVAMTRAADLLILSAHFKQAGRPTSPWLKLIAERFDLSIDQPRLANLVKFAGKLPKIRVHQTKLEAVQSTPSTIGFRRNPATLQDESSGDGPVSLGDLRGAIERSEPAALPDSIQVIPPDRAARRRFSVSEIETIDEQIRAGSGGKPASHRPREKPEDRDADSGNSGDLSSAEQLGTLVHAVLERLDFGHPQDAEALLEKFSSFSASPVEPSARAAAAACVANLMESPLGADLASAQQIHREIDFLLRFPPLSSFEVARSVGEQGSGRLGEGETRRIIAPPPHLQVVISGTIDCLFESADGAWTVLDYKTGVREKSTPAAELLADYEIQLGLYALAVREFLKRLPDRIELAFIRNGVDRVVFEPTESKLDEITSRVGRVLSETCEAASPAMR